ncbi:MAG: RNA methyltransferase [Bacteroidetes bacterium]|nr:RNA methyltransferase [Bacteroidota bacterium]
MLSKNTIKFINSLQKKKNRNINKLFIVEGDKIVKEIIKSELEIDKIFFTKHWEENIIKNNLSTEIVNENELKKISSLKTPNNALAIVKMPNYKIDKNEIENELSIVLDDLQDPGNLGTIIRTADWFGIKNIICSQNSADVYNPKVVQATMGAIARVKVHYVDIEKYLSNSNFADDFKIYGTFLNGKNMNETKLSDKGLIIMGNESQGISKNIERFVNEKLFIPNYPSNSKTSESLNVSTATAIVCYEFRRGKVWSLKFKV